MAHVRDNSPLINDYNEDNQDIVESSDLNQHSVSEDIASYTNMYKFISSCVNAVLYLILGSSLTVVLWFVCTRNEIGFYELHILFCVLGVSVFLIFSNND